MKLRTLVVDDEIEAQKRLLLHLQKFEVLELVGTSQNGQEALNAIETLNPQIVFLDIEMPEMNGIEVLANCKEPYPYIVFVTAYDQYAVRAFEQNAIDYVLKPYAFGRIEQAVFKAVGTIEKDRLVSLHTNLKSLLSAFPENQTIKEGADYIKRVAVKSIGKTTFIDVDDIVWIAGADQYIEVYTSHTKFTVRESMDKLEKSLDPHVFFRTHRSAIVNLNQVLALENLDKHTSLVILKDKQKIKISNTRKQAFKEKMNI
ncbi:LytTR family DNA-binding domain-containing protein [uncultured Croceitalea sp.]|uniref:LytR/AlgR family response regulator transcription factor n=1 Tax=uncultured Croceitalea sp. TaxID=1798908 RepID=UPI003305837A